MIKVKKIVSILAVVLFMSQIITVLPVYAEEGETSQEWCCHRDCNNYKEGYVSYCSKCNYKMDNAVSNEDGMTHIASISCDGCAFKTTYESECYFMDGYCAYCKQPQKYTICFHQGCENPVAEGSIRCKSCTSEIMYKWVKFDENTHQEYIWYPCCRYDYATGKLSRHGFEDTENGKRCKFCRYTINNSPNDSDNKSHSENVESNPTNNVGEPKSENDVIESIPASTVISNGKQISSSITTINISTTINGMAVATSKQDVRNAIGITNEETNTSFYVCNNDNNIIKRNISLTLKDNGKTVYNIFNADLYSITNSGKIEKIHSIDNPITLIFGIPAELQNKKVSIVAYNNKTGEYAEFQDVDNDSKTITIDATVFGIYALVVEND